MNKIALWISNSGNDWTTESAMIASNDIEFQSKGKGKHNSAHVMSSQVSLQIIHNLGFACLWAGITQGTFIVAAYCLWCECDYLGAFIYIYE